jgi:hypothetical protein
MNSVNIQEIAYERGVDLIAESQVEESLDIGHSMVYRLKHPQEGTIVVVSSSVGQSAMVRV